MDDREFKRLFDQVQLPPEEEEAMLERLLDEERRTSPMKPVKKTVTILVAAALLLMACAFTVATGLDQRFLAYFRGTQEDAQQVAGGVVGVEQTFRYESGWTIHIQQVLADRYSLAVLTEVVAPEGTVLDGAAYTLTPMWLMESGGEKLDVDFSMEVQEQSCTVPLPEQDGGRTYTLSVPIRVDGETMTLSELYLSPISAAFVLRGEPGEERTLEESDLTRIEEEALLHLADGEEVPIRRMVSQTIDADTGAVHSVFQTDTILKPEDVGSVTLLGQTFSLEELAFAEG